MNVEVHVAGNKPNGGVWMGGTVVEELGDSLGCCGGSELTMTSSSERHK